MERRRAVTILELLVVMTILVMLSSILFPVFGQAKEAAKKTACFSNVRQASFGTTLYCGDYDDTFSAGWNINMPQGPELNYYDALFWWGGFHVVFDAHAQNVKYTYHPEWGFIYPYLKNTEIQACASTPMIPNGYDWNIGYGYNPILLTSSFPTVEPKVHASQVDRPAETALYGDAASPYCAVDEGCSLYVPNQINPPSKYMSIHGRHRARANIGFADGHAQSMPVSLRPAEYIAPFIYGKDPQMWVDYDAQEKVGDLMNPRYPYGSPGADYYFLLDKPK